MGQRIPEKEIANFQFAELAKYRKQHKNNQQAGSLIMRLPAFFYANKCRHTDYEIIKKLEQVFDSIFIIFTQKTSKKCKIMIDSE